MRSLIFSIALLISPLVLAQTVWLDDDWNEVSQSNAELYTTYPLVKQGNVWQLEIFDKKNNLLLFKGFINKASLREPGSIVGKFSWYAENGNIRRSGELDSNGKLTGELKEYYTDVSPSQLYRVTQYVHGRREGIERTYHGGHLWYETSYKNDLMDGVRTGYTKNKQPREEKHYRKGKLSGLAKTWFDNGQLWKVEQYKSGELIGTAKTYNNDGSLDSQTIYNNHHRKIGEIKFDKNGQKRFEITWSYTKNTTTEETIWYKEGKFDYREKEVHTGQHRVKESFNDEGIILTRSEKLKGQRTGLQISNNADWSDSPIILYYTNYQNGQLQGEYLEKQLDGKMLVKGSYYHGKKTGEWITDKDNKMIVSHFNHKGQYHGSYLEKNDKGDVLVSGNFTKGIKTGKWTTVEGELTQIYHYDIRGRKSGEYLRLNRDKRILDKGEYLNNQMVGNWQRTDGNYTYYEQFDKKGRKHGEFKTIFKAETQVLLEHFNHDVENGWFEYRNEDGTLTAKGLFEAGKRQGPWQQLEQGYQPLILSGKYQDGRKVGEWLGKDDKGYLRHQYHYDNNGKYDGINYSFGSDGELLSISHYSHGDYVGKQFNYKDGKPSYIYIIKNGEKIKVQ